MPPRRKFQTVRFPERRDPLKIAAFLEGVHYGGGGLISVPKDLIDDAVAILRNPPPMLPIPEELLAEWDAVSAAINAVLVAQPGQMTSAAARLGDAQRAFQYLCFDLSVRSLRKPVDTTE